MQTNLWLSFLSAFELASVVIGLALLIHRGRAASWPLLSVALAVEVLTDVSLTWFLLHPRQFRGYFYTYWISTALQALLRLGVVADIIRSFPGLDFLPRRVYLVAGTFSAALAGGCASYAFHSAPKTMAGLIGSVLLIERGVDFALLTFVVGCLVCARVLCFAWSAMGAKVTSVLFARLAARAILGELLSSHTPKVRAVGNVFEMVVTISVMIYLAYCITTTPGVDVPASEPAASSHLSFPALFSRSHRRSTS